MRDLHLRTVFAHLQDVFRGLVFGRQADDGGRSVEATPGFRSWGAWPLLAVAGGVLFMNLFVLGFVLFMLVQVLLLERPRWKPWRWTTPWMFPKEWRD